MSLCHLLRRLCSPISVSVLHQSIHNFSTNALVGQRLNLQKRVKSLIRASDLDAASHLARHSVFSNTRLTVLKTASDGSYVDLKEKKITESEKLSQMDNTTDLSDDAFRADVSPTEHEEIFLQSTEKENYKRKKEQTKHMVAQQQQQQNYFDSYPSSNDGSAARPTDPPNPLNPTEPSYDIIGHTGGDAGGGDAGGGDGGGDC